MRSWFLFVLLFLGGLSSHSGFRQEPEKPSGPPPTAVVSTPKREATLLLKEGTPVNLKILHALNSKTVVSGDPLNFALAEDLVLNGKTIVKAGACAIGRVRQAKPARTMGRGAELGIEIQYLKAGSTRVPLRGFQQRGGQGKTAETVTLTALFGLNGLLKHGSEIVVKEGSLFTAYVDQDTPLPVLPQPPATANK